ncbi:MAG: agmatinase [Planctomycetota bacterium]|jgi:agmatinase
MSREEDSPEGQLNFLGLSGNMASIENAGAAVLSVPYEKTSTYGNGSEAGPAAIILASQQVELFDTVLGAMPYRLAGGIATIPAITCLGKSVLTLIEELRVKVNDVLSSSKFPVVLGGEHMSVVGAIKAATEKFSDLTILQLDAHSDLYSEYEGDEWNHACTAARILDFHDHIVQVGVRSQSADERDFVVNHSIPVFYAHDIYQKECAKDDWISPIIDSIRKYVYVSVDCDVFDPSIVPATGTPEPGGLSWRQIDGLLRCLCAERDVVGLDVSELSPLAGSHQSEYTIAKLVSRFIGYRFGIQETPN